MQGQLDQVDQLMRHFRTALSEHEIAVQNFLSLPNESNSERMAAAYEQAQELRHTLQQIFAEN